MMDWSEGVRTRFIEGSLYEAKMANAGKRYIGGDEARGSEVNDGDLY